MFGQAQRAIIKKDIRELFINKQATISLAVVPAMFTLVMPIILGIVAGKTTQEELGEFGGIMAAIPIYLLGDEPGRLFFYYMINMIFPVFFLMIPIMTSGIMSANSFVGEKERGTLETLFFSRMTIRSIFMAKVMGCFVSAMVMMMASFVVFFFVIIALSAIFFDNRWMFDINWIFIMLLLGPALSLLAETVTVAVSARSKTFMEAQQMSALLIVPLLMLIMGQFTGLYILGPTILVTASIISLAVACILLYITAGRFKAEKILR